MRIIIAAVEVPARGPLAHGEGYVVAGDGSLRGVVFVGDRQPMAAIAAAIAAGEVISADIAPQQVVSVVDAGDTGSRPCPGPPRQW